MENIPIQILFFLEVTILVSAVLMNFAKKNLFSLFLYFIQSITLVVLLLLSATENYSNLLMVAIFSTIIVKIFIAPYLFLNLINRHNFKISAGDNLSDSISLLFVFLLGLVTYGIFSGNIHSLATLRPEYLMISFWSILVSIFIVISKRGIVSQILGILSLENSIVSFALFSGLEQSATLQIGITFNILVWVVVSSLFISMIYSHFGALDTNKMKGLTE